MPLLQIRRRTDLHLNRKAFHAISGTLCAYLFAFHLNRSQGLWCLGSIGFFLFAYDLLRLAFPNMNKLAFRVMGPLMRREELRKPSAQFFYILGLVWAVGVLPKPIAIQAILTLAWMDPVAALVGKAFGQRRWQELLRRFVVDDRPAERVGMQLLGAKTLEGSAAGFAVAVLAGVVAWTGPWAAVDLGVGRLWWPSVTQIFLLSSLGAWVAVVAEAWPSQWDDNAMIPFWTGLLVWMAALWWNLPLPLG